jgi:aryl-phospho-beta-D-glucosidase BglC (GH1 family)
MLLVVVLLAVPAAAARAVVRMPVGFFDDPSFRWSSAFTKNLASAQAANGSIVHVLVDWSSVATSRPKHPLNGNDPAYHLSDVDALVRTAPKYGLQVLMTIARTPKWANGGKTPNYLPTKLNDLTQFCQMLAQRYNGSKPGFGVVTRFSVWNEPNLQMFLAPQFKGTKIVSPAAYAKLYMACYKGIKAGNKNALVAAGETSNRGHNKPTGGVSDSVAPATFARLVAEANPKLPLDAWATHPYPTSYNLGPDQKVAYPNVSFATMSRFGADLKKWFKRPVPIWVTEYGEQTKPEYSLGGISYAEQAVHAKAALKLAQSNPYVQMFIWFILRDSTHQTWFSGLIQGNGNKKPSYNTFKTAAKGIDGQSQVVAPNKTFTVKVPFPIMANYNAPGSKVGVTWKILIGKKLYAIGQPLLPLSRDGTVTIKVNFKPAKGLTYTMRAVANDKTGRMEEQIIALLPSTS